MKREHGHGAGDFDGGGRAEAGAEGNVAGEVEIEGWRFDATLLQLAEHADGIVGPVPRAAERSSRSRARVSGKSSLVKL